LYKQKCIPWVSTDVKSIANSKVSGIIYSFVFCFSFYFLHVILDLQSIINDDEQSNLTNNSKDWRTTCARETKKEEQDKEDDEN